MLFIAAALANAVAAPFACARAKASAGMVAHPSVVLTCHCLALGQACTHALRSLPSTVFVAGYAATLTPNK